MSDPNLVTTFNFNNREYFIKMHVTNTILELVITDKQTGEDWQCCYDAAYIENITQKTGNFKQFHVFTAMLKSGLLKTSNSVYLDLMTFDDLDALRNHRVRGPYSVYHNSQASNNRRYLILTYTVEFDRIHYPLPLEYCGPPDPKILQQNINKLQQEVTDLKEQLRGRPSRGDNKSVIVLQKKIDALTEENCQLKNETERLTHMLDKKSKNHSYVLMLQKAIKNLEASVLSERKSHHKLVDKLRRDKVALTKELDKMKSSEKVLKTKLGETKRQGRLPHISSKRSDPGAKGDSRGASPRPVGSPRPARSEAWDAAPTSRHTSRSPKPNTSRRSTSTSSHIRSPRSSSGSSRGSPQRPLMVNTNTTVRRSVSDLDFTSLESRIVALQRMLHKGMHIT